MDGGLNISRLINHGDDNDDDDDDDDDDDEERFTIQYPLRCLFTLESQRKV